MENQDLKPSVRTAITGILLAREPGLLRKYGKEEEKGRNPSQMTNK
jgi:hypothetical protein